LISFFDEAGTIEQIIPSLKTLTKVVENLVSDPMEPKFRSLNTTKKAVQEKLLKWKAIFTFLSKLGFQERGDSLNMVGYNAERLKAYHEAILEQIKSNPQLGARVSAGSFNPFAEGVSNTSGTNATKLVGAKVKDADKYDPNYVQGLIDQEKKNKVTIMERELPDREVEVFGSSFSG